MAFRQGARRAATAALALAMLTFFKAGCSTENVVRKNEPKGDSTFVSQVFSDKTEIRGKKQTHDSLLKAPSIEELEKYKPFGGNYEGMFHGERRGEGLNMWGKIEKGLPFELTKGQWSQYAESQKAEIQSKWDKVKLNMQVAFMTDGINSPEMAAEGIKNGSISPEQVNKSAWFWKRFTEPMPDMRFPETR